MSIGPDVEVGDKGQMLSTAPSAQGRPTSRWRMVALVIVLLLSLLLNVVVIVIASGQTHSSGEPGMCGPEGKGTAATNTTLPSPDSICSGNGIIHADAPTKCECYQCYVGPQCEAMARGCTLDAGSGNPLIFEKYWQERSEAALCIAPSFHIGYRFANADNVMVLPALDEALRHLHLMVGNVAPDVVKGHHLVIGTGSTQLISAALMGLSHLRAPRTITASKPYYGPYHSLPMYFNNSHSMVWKDTPAAGDDVVEFVTAPNNPDGSMRAPRNTSADVVYDRAYYWPHYTPIHRPLADDLMLFTLSKITGHAGLRLGWAFVKDKALAEKMWEFVGTSTLGVSHDAQWHATGLVQYMLRRDASPMRFAASEMQRRWQRLKAIEAAAKRPRVTLQPLMPSQKCLFWGSVRDPSPAYAWLKCQEPDDEDCWEVLKTQGSIKGRNGGQYGASEKYVRLSLLMRPREFDILSEKLEAFMNPES